VHLPEFALHVGGFGGAGPGYGVGVDLGDGRLKMEK